MASNFLESVLRVSSFSGDSTGNPWFHDFRFMDFFGSPRGDFTGILQPGVVPLF